METETETKQKAREGNQDVNRAQATEKEKEKNQAKPEERNQDYQHRLHQPQSQNPNRRHQSECWQDQQMAQKATQTEPAHCQQVLPHSMEVSIVDAALPIEYSWDCPYIQQIFHGKLLVETVSYRFQDTVNIR